MMPRQSNGDPVDYIYEFSLDGTSTRNLTYSHGNSTWGCIMENETNFIIVGSDNESSPYYAFVYDKDMNYLGYTIATIDYRPAGCEYTDEYMYICDLSQLYVYYHNGTLKETVNIANSGIAVAEGYIWGSQSTGSGPPYERMAIKKYYINGTLIDTITYQSSELGGKSIYFNPPIVADGDYVYIGLLYDTVKMYLPHALQNVNITTNITAYGSDGIVEIKDIHINLSSNQNITVWGYKQGDSSNNVSHKIMLVNSKFTITKPYDWTDTVFWFPNSLDAKNVSPYGQNANTPIFNITSQADKPFDVGIKLNSSVDPCINLTISNTGNVLDGTTFNTSSWSDTFTIINTLSPGESAGIWLWAQLYGCSSASRFAYMSTNIMTCCTECVPCW